MILKIRKMSELINVDDFLKSSKYKCEHDFRWIPGSGGNHTNAWFCQLEIYNDSLSNLIILKFF